MPVWIPVALAVTALAALSASSRSAGHAAEASPRGASPHTGASRAPGAIETLNAFMRKGLTPPREVAELAAEEARAAGIHDLASEIEQTFLARAPARAGASQGPAQPDRAALPKGSAQVNDAAFLGVPGAAQASNANAPSAGDAALLGPPPTAAAPSIPGVAAEQWGALCAQLERERPEYDSQRHVGRYRQSKDRLRELGVDPASIACNPAAQDDALVADLTDAYEHLARAGVLERVLGKPIVLPDVEDAPALSLSGLLAVCTAGGLDACASWLRSKTDRARFRHTTNLFLRCNGIF
jgi:hypothetical protein